MIAFIWKFSNTFSIHVSSYFDLEYAEALSVIKITQFLKYWYTQKYVK